MDLNERPLLPPHANDSRTPVALRSARRSGVHTRRGPPTLQRRFVDRARLSDGEVSFQVPPIAHIAQRFACAAIGISVNRTVHKLRTARAFVRRPHAPLLSVVNDPLGSQEFVEGLKKYFTTTFDGQEALEKVSMQLAEHRTAALAVNIGAVFDLMNLWANAKVRFRMQCAGAAQSGWTVCVD